jgi:hypothetical protein
MANLRNIDAEVGANMIGDDSGPTLTLYNSSTGQTLKLESKAGNRALDIAPTTVGNASIAPVRIAAVSTASAPAIEFVAAGGFISITSIVLTTVANFDYAIRVRVGNELRWIPLIKDAGIIGGAAF